MLEKHGIVSRAGWGSGPWDTEPDRVEFRHAGLPCLLRRVDHGGWCGYVAVPPGHPLHGTGLEEADDALGGTVHGGLTYASECNDDVCHVPEAGEPDNVWWLGFDAAHGGDLIPGMQRDYTFLGLLSMGGDRLGSSHYGTYRDMAYMQRDVRLLAEKLAMMTKVG